jgi:crossover junction endodeoxyribonuclease RuvC
LRPPGERWTGVLELLIAAKTSTPERDAVRAGAEVSAAACRIARVEMIVVGIDPGTAATGYGVVARRNGRLIALDGGVIATAPGVALERRLATIHDRVSELLELHAPVALAVEELYFGRNARSALAVGQARGAILLAAGRRGVPCAGYTPQQVKGAVCGSGNAAKEQVGRMVAALLSLPEAPRADHAADALAVAICHLHRVPRALAEAVA